MEEGEPEVQLARRKIGERFIEGRGIEVGAGSRAFSLLAGAEVLFGDIRDKASLQSYFSAAEVATGSCIDAQTFASLPDSSVDFIISAHVIEHLRDPIGAIVSGFRVLRPLKIYLLVVPDMRFTFDRNRPETTVEHVMRDFTDGGENSCYQAYQEHLRFVHPYLTGKNYDEAEIDRQSRECARRWREFDIHFHAWTRPGFEALLKAAAQLVPFHIEEIVSVANENIFVLRKLPAAARAQLA
jgi:SAM-dependent methyltransferase